MLVKRLLIIFSSLTFHRCQSFFKVNYVTIYIYFNSYIIPSTYYLAQEKGRTLKRLCTRALCRMGEVCVRHNRSWHAATLDFVNCFVFQINCKSSSIKTSRYIRSWISLVPIPQKILGLSPTPATTPQTFWAPKNTRPATSRGA